MKNKALSLIHYLTASWGKRYSCKLEAINGLEDTSSPTIIEYQALNRLDLRRNEITEIVIDPQMVAKFHPIDAFKLGAIMVGDVIFKNQTLNTKEEMHEAYTRLCENLLENRTEG